MSWAAAKKSSKHLKQYQSITFAGDLSVEIVCRRLLDEDVEGESKTSSEDDEGLEEAILVGSVAAAAALLLWHVTRGSESGPEDAVILTLTD